MNTLKKFIFSLVAVALFAVLSDCTEEPKSRVWYKNHPEEGVKVYKKCKTSGEDLQNCRHAYSAPMRISNTK